MCAECHTHKYDPITQEEYYQFYSFFNNTADGGNYSVEPTMPVPPPALRTQVDYLHAEIATRAGRISQSRKPISPGAGRLGGAHGQQERMSGQVLTLTNAVSTGGATLTNLPIVRCSRRA